jgi:hypothetical protein
VVSNINDPAKIRIADMTKALTAVIFLPGIGLFIVLTIVASESFSVNSFSAAAPAVRRKMPAIRGIMELLIPEPEIK